MFLYRKRCRSEVVYRMGETEWPAINTIPPVGPLASVLTSSWLVDCITRVFRSSSDHETCSPLLSILTVIVHTTNLLAGPPRE